MRRALTVQPAAIEEELCCTIISNGTTPATPQSQHRGHPLHHLPRFDHAAIGRLPALQQREPVRDHTAQQLGVGFLVGVYGLWTQQAWARLVLIASAVASIIVIVPWTNVWPGDSVFGAVLFDAVVLVAFLPAWRGRFAEEREPL